MPENRNEYFNEYRKKNLKRVPLDLPVQQYERLKRAAAAAGEPINTYIKKSIAQRMESQGDIK